MHSVWHNGGEAKTDCGQNVFLEPDQVVKSDLNCWLRRIIINVELVCTYAKTMSASIQ